MIARLFSRGTRGDFRHWLLDVDILMLRGLAFLPVDEALPGGSSDASRRAEGVKAVKWGILDSRWG